MPFSKDLAALATACGVEVTYVDSEGGLQRAKRDAVVATLVALGVPSNLIEQPKLGLAQIRARRCDRVVEPVIVAWQGRACDVEIILPKALAGEEVRMTLAGRAAKRIRFPNKAVPGIKGYLRQRVRLPALPLGYHKLEIEAGPLRAHALVIRAPLTAQPPPRRPAWGLFAPVSALRGDGPHGTLADLEALQRWARKHGAKVVATLPLLADGDGARHDASPYNPETRAFWDEAYLDVQRVPEAKDARVRAVRRKVEARQATLRRKTLVHRGAARQAMRPVLEAMLDSLLGGGGSRLRAFVAYVASNPEAVRYAQCKSMEEKQADGRDRASLPLPASLVAATGPSMAAVYHLYVQWLMDQQLAATSQRMARSGWGLYLDVPVGSRPDGFDATRHGAEFVSGASIGAPPDMFFTKGQSWGFPPPHPERMREAGYASFRDAVTTAMRHAGIVRIDHVLGLHRLYWVPQGHDAKDGVYVRYRSEEMYAILTLESRRHGTVIVGEDLGTVPPEVRRAMAKHGLLRSYGWQFEASVADPLPVPPRLAVASLNTHDARPFAAWWHGLDIDARLRLGLVGAAQAKRERAGRERLRTAVGLRLGVAKEGDVFAALLGWLDASPAALVLVNMEDLWDETNPVNDPADPAAPNWRRRHALDLHQAGSDPVVSSRLAQLRRRSA